MRGLVADDEEGIRNVIREYLEFDGHTVAEAANGAEAVSLCRMQKFDFIVMDIMMPVMDGFAACREIRRGDPSVPVLMLSARGEEYDKLKGFQLGIDDYVVKPFSPRELMMRVGAVLRRAQAPGSAENVHETVRIENMLVDFTARQVTIDGTEVELSPKEYDLLVYMAQNKNIALTREMLITNVWGYDFYGDERVVDSHIKNLRHKLERDYIETVRGVGYRVAKETC